MKWEMTKLTLPLITSLGTWIRANPRLEAIEGMKCYATLSDLPVKVDVVDFVVPPLATEAILKECLELGLERIWLQPGSESEAAISFCRENNLKVVHDVCVMMK